MRQMKESKRDSLAKKRQNRLKNIKPQVKATIKDVDDSVDL